MAGPSQAEQNAALKWEAKQQKPGSTAARAPADARLQKQQEPQKQECIQAAKDAGLVRNPETEPGAWS